MFLAGALGMGKTRLAAEFARGVHDQGGQVLYGHCEPAPPDPLQPFVQALVGWGAAGRAVPGVQRSPKAFGEGLAELLAGRPDARVLLVLDDLHLAKAPMLEVLAALVAAATMDRLLVLGAYQEKVSPELAALVPRLEPSGVGPRRLGPFDKDEVAQVLALYGTEQAARAAAHAVLEATGGVPAHRRLRERRRHRLGRGPQALGAPGLRYRRPPPDRRGMERAAPHPQLPARLPVGGSRPGMAGNELPVTCHRHAMAPEIAPVRLAVVRHLKEAHSPLPLHAYELPTE